MRFFSLVLLLLVGPTLACIEAPPAAPANIPDMNTDDASNNVTDMESDAGCVSESDDELCDAALAQCGSLDVTDGCGVLRSIEDCGACPDDLQCAGGGTANRCGSPDKSDAEICSEAEATCGLVEYEGRDVLCGTCEFPDACQDNQCVCVDRLPDDLCQNAGFTCGELKYPQCDGTEGSVQCGTCDPNNEGCSENMCVCLPESNAGFCRRIGECGSVTAPDNCGRERSAECGCEEGDCVPNPDLAIGGNVCCLPESAGEICARENGGTEECQIRHENVVDNCGVLRTVNCDCTCLTTSQACAGRCGDYTAEAGCQYNCGDTCSQSQVCSDQNECCTPNNDTQAFCQGKCGTLDFTNNCGETMSVDCGGCSGLNWCVSNECRGIL